MNNVKAAASGLTIAFGMVATMGIRRCAQGSPVGDMTDATYYAGRLEQAGLGDAQRQAAPRTYGVTLMTRF